MPKKALEVSPMRAELRDSLEFLFADSTMAATPRREMAMASEDGKINEIVPFPFLLNRDTPGTR